MKLDDLNPENYSANKFARGFIAYEGGRNLSDLLADQNLLPTLSRWEKTYFGPAQVWYDARLNYASMSEPKIGVAVMGLCINPFTGAANNKDVSLELFSALKSGRLDFLNYVDQLSGAFVIFFRENANVEILQDCAATKPVYFIKGAEGTFASSHITPIGVCLKLKKDERVDLVYQNDEYKKDPSRYLPGDITRYKGVRALTANTLLKLREAEVERFFPRENLPSRQVDLDLIHEVINIFEKQARILAATGRDMFVATTAGRDSRWSVAAFSGYENCKLFTFHMKRSGHLSEDVTVGEELAAEVGKSLQIFDLDDYRLSGFRPTFDATSPSGIWPQAALCYINEFRQDAIHIRSTVSEIGRAFYSKRKSQVVSPKALGEAYTSTEFSKSDLVLEAMRGFIDQAKFSEDNFFNYNMYDMFYWEHRNSKWQNILCQEAEMASDVFIPYNNRELIKILLSVPLKDRQNATIHTTATNIMEPNFMHIGYIS